MLPPPPSARRAGSHLRAAAPTTAPYRSFWQAGFEGADHVNGRALPLSMNRMSGHLARAAGDYRRLAEHGLLTARESLGWRACESGGTFDFASVRHRERRAQDAGVQLLWTLFHYGRPDDLCLFERGFHDRFVRYCAAAARFLKPLHAGTRVPVYTPINEISFLSWAACETGLIHPYAGDRAEQGYRLKRALVRATIAAIDAILEVDPRARFLIVDPLLYVAPSSEGDVDEARRQHEFQFQAWDMLAGVLEPQLGGAARYLDLVGVNYYPHNQWQIGSRETLPWPVDRRRRPLRELLGALYRRYRRPITISETGHVGDARVPWLLDVAGEARAAMEDGVRIDGICLYPIVDRPDWEQPGHWHDCGLWSARPPRMRRTVHAPYAHALRLVQSLCRSPNAFPLQEHTAWTP